MNLKVKATQIPKDSSTKRKKLKKGTENVSRKQGEVGYTSMKDTLMLINF